MDKNRKLFVCAVFVFVLVIALTLIACGDEPRNNPKSEILPTLTKVKIIPQINAHNGDEDSDVCLEVLSNMPEAFTIEVTIANPDNYDIISLDYNGKTYQKSEFSADSTNKVIYIRNIQLYETSGTHVVTIDEIKYSKSNATAKIMGLKGNVKNVQIQPTFKLTLDLSESSVKGEKVIVNDNDYSARLNVPVSSSMNDYVAPNENTVVYGTQGYIFAGWFTEEDGKGARYTENDQYIFYKDVTLYAHYARAFTYREEGDGIVITGMSKEGKETSFDIEIPREIDGVSIRKIGANAFTSVGAGKKFILPETIVEIGDYAFMNCTKLQIDLGSVEKIGKMSFANSGKITLGSAGVLYAKRDAYLPTTLREIGDYAFKGCSWDTWFINPYRDIYTKKSNTLLIPQTVNKIGAYAFSESLFEEVYFESAISLDSDNTGASVFEGSKSLKSVYTAVKYNESGTNFSTSATSGLKAITDRMFYGCTALKSSMNSVGVKINEGVESIGELSFASNGDGMVNLNFVALPDTLMEIGKQAFANTGLTQVTFSEGSNLQTLGEYCFENSKFSEITLHSLSTYGMAPFWGNTKLKAINILTNNVPVYKETNMWGSGLTRKAKYYVKKEMLASFRAANGSWAVDGSSDYICAYDYIVTESITGTTLCFEPIGADGNLDFSSTNVKITSVFDVTREIVIPSTVMFDNVTYNVTAVGQYFVHDEVTKITLPDTIERIEKRAFYTCKILYEVIWRSGTKPLHKNGNADIALKSIGESAFSGTAITYFYSNTALNSIGKQAFHNCPNLSTVVLDRGTALTVMGSAFSQSGLKTLVIGLNVKRIYDSAFQGNKELAIVLINLSDIPESTEGNYPSISPFRECSGISKIWLFSNNAMANFTANKAPNGKNNTYADLKKADGITSAYEKYQGTWSEALNYYHI